MQMEHIIRILFILQHLRCIRIVTVKKAPPIFVRCMLLVYRIEIE